MEKQYGQQNETESGFGLKENPVETEEKIVPALLQPKKQFVPVFEEAQEKKTGKTGNRKILCFAVLGFLGMVVVWFIWQTNRKPDTILINTPTPMVTEEAMPQVTPTQTPTPVQTPEVTPAPIYMPDIIGTKAEQAEKKLTNLGIQVKISRKYSNMKKKGQVISQSIAAGKEIREGITVTITVSKGAKPEAETDSSQNITKVTSAPVITKKPVSTKTPVITKAPDKKKKSTEKTEDVTESDVVEEGE